MLGVGLEPSIFRVPKSVCVSSFEAGPRSWDLGAERLEEERGEAWENCRWGELKGIRRESSWRDGQWEVLRGEKRKVLRSRIVGRVRDRRVGGIVNIRFVQLGFRIFAELVLRVIVVGLVS